MTSCLGCIYLIGNVHNGKIGLHKQKSACLMRQSILQKGSPMIQHIFVLSSFFIPTAMQTSLPYFGVKLSCVFLCLLIERKVMTYGDPSPSLRWPNPTVTYIVTLRWPNVTLGWPIVTLRWPIVTPRAPTVTHSDPTHSPYLHIPHQTTAWQLVK